MNHPLTPFVDKLAVPPRRVIGEPTRLTARLETTTHRFHRGLPPSPVWTHDGLLPGPTIEIRPDQAARTTRSRENENAAPRTGASSSST
jgi:hypothetical protein